MCNGKHTAIIKIALYKNTNYNKTKKSANYNNRDYANCREVLYITSNSKASNNIEYFSIHVEMPCFESLSQ